MRRRNASSTIRRYRLNNFTGGMNTTSELNAFSTVDPNAFIGAGVAQQVPLEFINLTNWMPYQRGGLTKSTGFSLYFNVGSSTPVTGVYRYLKSDGTNLFIVSYGTTLAKYTGSLTSLSTGLTNGAMTHFETANDYLVVCDGTISPLKFDGTTVSALGGSPPAGAKQSLWYQNRLWIYSATNNQSLVYYSNAGNIEAGYAGNFVQCDVNDGQKITGIYKYFIPGQIEPVIIVAKERSMGLITGDGSTANPYTFSKLSFDIGMAAFRAFVQYDQDVLFLTPRGINTYRGAVKNINIDVEMLTRKVRDQFTSLSQTYAANSCAWFDPVNKRVSFAVPTGANVYADTIWHFDTEQACWYKQTGFTTTCAFLDKDNVVYRGDDQGNVLKNDTSVLTYNGAGINAAAQTGYMDFFEPKNYKRIREATIYVRGNGSYTMGIGCTLNFGADVGSSHSVNVGNRSYLWNGGTWTSDPLVYQWGGPPIVRKKFFPRGIFQNISFTFTNSGASQPLDVFELDLEVEFLNQD